MSETDRRGVEVFTDTSVLFNYALDARQQRADELLIQHECVVVATETVKREFEAVKDRRQEIHTELLPYIKRYAVEEYEPENPDSMTENDWGYVREFRSVLGELEPAEAARRVQERNRQLKRGYRELFEGNSPYVGVIQVPTRDANLLGQLSGIIQNDADARILCDAVEWKRDGGSGHFITSDVNDMLADSEGEDDESDDDEELPDSFEGLLAGDPRTAPEQINDAVSQRYDDSCCLELHSIDTFLRKY